MKQDQRVFWTLSIVRNSKYWQKNNVLETGSVSVFRWGKRDIYSVGSLRKSSPQSLNNPCHKTIAIQAADTRMSRRKVTGKYAVKNCTKTFTEWNSVFYLFRSPDDTQSPETRAFWVFYTIVRTLPILTKEAFKESCILLSFTITTSDVTIRVPPRWIWHSTVRTQCNICTTFVSLQRNPHLHSVCINKYVTQDLRFPRRWLWRMPSSGMWCRVGLI
jgi:hypothetical protein